MKTQKILRICLIVVPIALCAYAGFGNGQKALGWIEFTKKNYEAAAAHFQEAGDQSGLGLVALSKKDVPGARAAFAKVEDHRGLGLCALEDFDFETAEREFTLVNDQDGLCLLALKQGHLEEAMRLAVAQKDSSLEGMIHLAQGNLPAAERAFTAANDANGLGDVYSAGRRFAEARAAFELAHNPVKVIQSYRNDFTLGDGAKNDQAIAYGLKAAAEGRMPVECLCEVADAQYHAGRPEDALATLAEADRLPGAASEVALRRGRILFFQRDYEGARAAFSSVKAGEVSAIAHRATTESLETLDRYRDLNLASAR
jgi:tetratricopeptide (TPR) repeat protein